MENLIAQAGLSQDASTLQRLREELESLEFDLTVKKLCADSFNYAFLFENKRNQLFKNCGFVSSNLQISLEDYVQNYFDLRACTLIAQMDFQALDIFTDRYSHDRFKIPENVSAKAIQYHEIQKFWAELDFHSITVHAKEHFSRLKSNLGVLSTLFLQNYVENLANKITSLYNTISIGEVEKFFDCS